MPAACAIRTVSACSNTELDSACEPPRSTIAVSALPVPCSVACKPSPIASSATSTPTTPAMPITITDDAPQRAGNVARPTPVTLSVRRPARVSANHSTSKIAAMAAPYHGSADQSARTMTRTTMSNKPRRKRFMGYSSAASQRIYDFQVHAAQRRQHSNHKPDHDHQHDRGTPDRAAHIRHRQRLAERGLQTADHHHRQQHAYDAANDHQQHGFRQHQ